MSARITEASAQFVDRVTLSPDNENLVLGYKPRRGTEGTADDAKLYQKETG